MTDALDKPPPEQRPFAGRTRRAGFTLVEILIVVLILGILAAVVLPKFSNASAVARASMLADDLRIMRMQLAVYKSQHLDVPAGYPDGDRTEAPTEEAFVEHMTMASNPTGLTAVPGTAGYEYGPYLREVPTNPVNGKSSVQVLADADPFPDAADDSHGWVYKPATMTIKADCPGADSDGNTYFDY
jgi:general secretion pathway protein G